MVSCSVIPQTTLHNICNASEWYDIYDIYELNKKSNTNLLRFSFLSPSYNTFFKWTLNDNGKCIITLPTIDFINVELYRQQQIEPIEQTQYVIQREISIVKSSKIINKMKIILKRYKYKNVSENKPCKHDGTQCYIKTKDVCSFLNALVIEIEPFGVFLLKFNNALIGIKM